jgi:sugar lactone lactonase YvrE
MVSRMARSLVSALFLLISFHGLNIGAAMLGPLRHFAGSTGGGGYADGTLTNAQFSFPSAVAVGEDGSVFVADTQNHTVRKVTREGVETLAGFHALWGSALGQGGAARFNQPGGIAVDGKGNVVVADTINDRIVWITPSGLAVSGTRTRTRGIYCVAYDAHGNVYIARNSIQKLTVGGFVTIAGNEDQAGSVDGSATEARFSEIRGLAVAGDGTIYVSDGGNHVIRRVSPAGLVTTIAGTATIAGSVDGISESARFFRPSGIAVGASGELYVADSMNHTIRRIDRNGQVSTVAGRAGEWGSEDGEGTSARFFVPHGLSMDRSGSVYVADSFNHAIRRIDSTGRVSTLAGRANKAGATDGPAEEARFNQPVDATVDAHGTLYVADSGNNTIRSITPAGVVSTYAGKAGAPGFVDGPRSVARFWHPEGIVVSKTGIVYVADTRNHVIRAIDQYGIVTTLAGSAGKRGHSDGSGTDARFNQPRGLTLDPLGTLYVADTANHVIRRISPGGTVTTLTGVPGQAGSADSSGSTPATFNGPRDVAFIGGNDEVIVLYVADTDNHVIRSIALYNNRAPIVQVRSGTVGVSGANLNVPVQYSLPLSVAGGSNEFGLYAYVVDTNSLVRDVYGSLVYGNLHSIGNTGGYGFDAHLNTPGGITTTVDGTIYVVDTMNNAIKKSVEYVDSPMPSPFSVAVGQPVTLGTKMEAGTTWYWEVVRRPVNSKAQLSSPTVERPTFVPDVADVYEFRLTVGNGTETGSSHRALGAFSQKRRAAE